MTTGDSRTDGHGLAELVATRHVVVCCGSGGVGKTTTAAALALAGAVAGRRAVVVTIDPAKRLASALGLDALPNTPVRIELDAPGSLWALTLDTKATFDALVRRHAPSPEQATRILDNRFYRNISTALSGTQEYMAMEKLYELAVDETTADDSATGGVPATFDLVVVDTPPTRNALDFITAPRRLMRLLDNRVFRVLMGPARKGFRVVGGATQAVLRGIGRVVGGEVIADTLAFFQAFEGMEDGFRTRANAVLDLLHDPATGWVLVTSPRTEAIEEARYFADRIHELGITVSALVANRMQPRFEPVPVLSPAVPEGSALARLVERARAANARADADERAVAALSSLVAPAPTVPVPIQPTDVHDLPSLAAVATALVGGTLRPPPGATGSVTGRAERAHRQ